MVLPLPTLVSSNRCKTRQTDWCAHCQDINTSHRHLYVLTGCRLSFESISRLLCSVSSAFMDTPPVILNAWSPSRRLRHATSARAPVSSRKIIHDDRKKSLAIEPFPMHPPRFGTVSRNHYSHSKILTPLSHCLKLTILEKRLIYNFFLVFHIVYIFAFYCKFKIVNRWHSNFGFNFNM